MAKIEVEVEEMEVQEHREHADKAPGGVEPDAGGA